MFKKPKITFGRIGQIIFTLREIIKIIAKTDLKLLIGMFAVSALWGITSAPQFYLQKLILDDLVKAIGNPNWKPLVYSIGILVGLRVSIDLIRSILSSFNN